MSSRVPRLMNDDGEVVVMQRCCNRRGQTDKWARVAPDTANPMNRISSCSDASIHCSLSGLPIHFGISPSLPPALGRIYSGVKATSEAHIALCDLPMKMQTALM